MINYIKSENYRLFRKKGLHMISVLCLLLIIAAAVTLYLFGKYDPSFPYATSYFFYSNVISSSTLILIVALLFNLSLTGKDMSIIKQSVSFGISRNAMFWSKLYLTVSYFLVICLIGLFLMIGLGENLFVNEEGSVSQFLIAVFNMLPIILSGFFMIHAMKMMKIHEVYIIVVLLLTFSFSGDLVRIFFKKTSGLTNFYQYAPSIQLNENLINFMEQNAHLEFRNWITGIIISIICLFIGTRRFAKRNID